MTSALTKQGWRLRAACRNHPDPDVFSSTRSTDFVDQARAICSWCPLAVRRECLAEAWDSGDDWTVRAGLTPAQRRELPRADQVQLSSDPALFRASGYRVRTSVESETAHD